MLGGCWSCFGLMNPHILKRLVSRKNTIGIAARALTKSHHTQGSLKPWILHLQFLPVQVQLTILGHFYHKQRSLVMHVVVILPLSGLQGNRLTGS